MKPSRTPAPTATDAEPNGHGLLIELRYVEDLKPGDVIIWRTEYAVKATPQDNHLVCVRTVDENEWTATHRTVLWSSGTKPRGESYRSVASARDVVHVVTVDPTYTGRGWS